MIFGRSWPCNLLIVCLVLINFKQIYLKCVNDTDCFSHGTCIDDTCICFDGWQGEQCQFCGGKIKLTNITGSIIDGIGNYSIGLKCTWLIEAEKNQTISLFFNEFATECNWDYFYVYDGDSIESPLIAAFNGLMFWSNYQIKRVPEIILKSGHGLLHFTSDDAYNMTGFNISYHINRCPSALLMTECSDHGACTSSLDCTCSAQWTGDACHVPLCPNNCSNHGICSFEKHRCICDTGFAGVDCSQIQQLGFWESFGSQSAPVSTSHRGEVWNNSFLIISGYNFQYHTNIKTINYFEIDLPNQYLAINQYDFETNDWLKVNNDNNINKDYVLISRYSYASSIINDKLYIYGGSVINEDGKELATNDFLEFDLQKKLWSIINITKCNRCLTPFRIIGHTMNVFESKLIIIFGFSVDFGYLNLVQEYDPSIQQWSILETRGFPVSGTYGHTTAFDNWSKKFYVYGGIIASTESNQKLINRIYSYDPISKLWLLLSSSPSARYFHTSVFSSPGMMLVFGGNTHNDTSHNYGSKCFSSDSLVYDTICDTWHYLNSPTNDLVQGDIARFGHSTVVYNRSIYIYGGFNGIVLNDLLKFTIGNCNQFNNQNECLNSRLGLKCVWNLLDSKCVALTNKMMYNVDRQIGLCAEQSRSQRTQNSLTDKDQCALFSDCLSCTQTSRNCLWCSNDMCSYEKCRDQSQSITDCNRFHFANYPYCRQLITCKTCNLNRNCAWDRKEDKCDFLNNFELLLKDNHTKSTYCESPCNDIHSCVNCTQEKCIWCQNQNRCVEKNAYIISFPYGQCREWTTMPSKCRIKSSKEINRSDQCTLYKSCRQCLDDPSCGWCDDGSNTGLGKCLSGGNKQPNPLDPFHACATNSWHFTSCPKCQCNGHSYCLPNSTICQQPCNNLISGPNCDRCIIGYWGNPLNGGKCLPCECNDRATFCHPETGKCFCLMKGLTGDYCDKCDIANHYHEDIYRKGVCYYDLTIDYQFTFNLSKKEDRFYTQINFRNSPIRPDIDAEFQITCSVFAKMNITIRQAGSGEKPFFSNQNCSSFRYRFTKSDYLFGLGDNVTLTTFYVYVYDFRPPLWIQISFSQYPKLNLQQFFITFTTCFLLLLMVAVLLWRIKQRFDLYRRRQRLFVEMEQMASRPFAQVYLDCAYLSLNVEAKNYKTTTKIKNSTYPVALEPCESNKAAVVTVLIRLPTGAEQFTQPGQSSGLAIGCALVNLSHSARKNSIDSFPIQKFQHNSKYFKKKFRRSNNSHFYA